MSEAITIKTGVEMPVPKKSGRAKGDGENLRLLNGLQPNQTLWNVSFGKAQSIRTSAYRLGIKVQVVKIPGTNTYAIKKL